MRQVPDVTTFGLFSETRNILMCIGHAGRQISTVTSFEHNINDQFVMNIFLQDTLTFYWDTNWCPYRILYAEFKIILFRFRAKEV